MDNVNFDKEKETENWEFNPAGFNERFVAYFIDALPFVVCWKICLFLFIKHSVMEYNFWNDLKVGAFWILLYVIYQTIFSSGGRATLGKYMLSIRIVDKFGRNLSLTRAFIRAVCYFISALPLNFGFIMASFTRDKRALHDYCADSRVISLKPKSDFTQGLIFAVSWGIIGILLATWYYRNFVRLPPREIEQVAVAKKGMIKLAKLEEIYKQKNGTYTNDIKALAELSGNVIAFKNELVAAIDPESLVISISTDGQNYIITARARNWRKTKIQISSLKE